MKNTKLTAVRASRVLSGSACKLKLSGTVVAGILAHALLMNPPQALAVAQTLGTVGLAWDSSPSSGVAGYRVYMGMTSGNYTSTVEAGNSMTSTVSGLSTGATYYFAVKAYDANGVESAFSNEIRFVPDAASLQLTVSSSGQAVLTVRGLSGHSYDIEATQDLRNWSPLGNVTVGTGGTASYTDTTAPAVLRRFYRTRELQQ